MKKQSAISVQRSALEHTKGIIEIYHRLVPETSQTLQAVASRAMAEIEAVELELALYERALALLRILRAEVPGNMFVTYEAGTGRNYREIVDELLAEIDGKETK